MRERPVAPLLKALRDRYAAQRVAQRTQLKRVALTPGSARGALHHALCCLAHVGIGIIGEGGEAALRLALF